MKTIYLLRHEECFSRGYTGSGSNVELTPAGKENARRTAGLLAEANLDVIFTSPMKRCIDTASPIADAAGLLPVSTDELREISFGSWEGRTYDEIEKISGDKLSAWLSFPELNSPPGGEKLDQMYERIEYFWRTEIVEKPHLRILIVSHGGPIRTLLSLLSGGGIKNHWAFSIDRGNFCIIKMYDDQKCQIAGTNLKQITE